MVFRKHRGRQTVMIKAGAEFPDDAIDRAEAFLAKRGIKGTLGWVSGGQRLKIGIAGWRRYYVTFLLDEVSDAAQE